MFAVIFVLALITAHAAREIPSYIHVCGRRDPNLNQCIVNNIDNLKDKVCEGIPEMAIPAHNPYTIEELIISDTPTNKIYIKDAKIMGICDFVVKSFNSDINRLHFDIEFLFKHIQINTTCDFSIRLLVPLAYKGLIYITTDNVGAKVGMDLKLATKHGEKYAYVSNLDINIGIKNYNAQFDLSRPELEQFHEIMKDFVDNNQEEIIKILKPILEEAISKRVILVCKNVFTRFTYPDLFPDRT